jgi:Na+/H+ antiporter NhaD/arsenite permease-like protein
VSTIAANAAAAPDLTATPLALLALGIFVIAYALVIAEERLGLRKSKPVTVAAGLIWCLVAAAYGAVGRGDEVAGLLRHNLSEFAELFLFLLTAMSYINTLEERGVFRALCARICAAGLSLRQIYWLTGLLAFCTSPVADNLTTAMILGSIALTVGAGQPRFLVLACIDIVVAANAGGAFCPFGDITTLMVWQSGHAPFGAFFALFLPALVSWLVPAACMAVAVPAGRPTVAAARAAVKPGGGAVAGLFLATLLATVCLHQFLRLPPFLGMMTGLGVLQLYGHRIRRQELAALATWPTPAALGGVGQDDAGPGSEGLDGAAEGPSSHPAQPPQPFDIFDSLRRAEWDTLMFFYGVMLAVGGLGALGYLAALSTGLYGGLGPTGANVLVGVLSAVVDNIPILYAVLEMRPDMAVGQWLLVTLTAGIGGSLLAIGSAAGVALMGQAHGIYTFGAHLRWTWAIALGYVASVLCHLAWNAGML